VARSAGLRVELKFQISLGLLSLGLQACDVEPSPDDSRTAMSARDPVGTGRMAPEEAPEGEEPTEEGGDIAPGVAPVNAAWMEIGPDDTEAHYSVDTTATLRVTNASETPFNVEVVVGGDQGTTAGITISIGSFELPANGFYDISVDLAPFLVAEAVTSSAAGVRIRLHDLESDDIVGQTSSLPIYFHVENDELVLYNATLLKDEFNSGDFGHVAPDAALLPDASIARIVEWSEPESDGVAEAISHDLPGDAYTVPHAAVYNHTLCARINAETYDSGFENSQGITEDIWPTANDGIVATGYGMKVRVGAAEYNTNPTTGCVTFASGYFAFTATVTGYAYFTNASGTYVRLHNAANDSEVSFPGSTHAYQILNVSFHSPTTTVVTFGDASNPGERLFTGAAAFATSLYRYGDGFEAGTEIHVSPAGACGAANVQYFNDFTFNEAYIRMQGYTCAGSALQAKFLVAHEYGHALGVQNADQSHGWADDTHDVTPSLCDFDGVNYVYGNFTKEWSSIAAREGWAHFVSARVWNDSASDGNFTWDGQHDLERWDASNTVRGYLKNVCCPGSPGTGCSASLDGAGTINDWMRAFWDLHTETCDDAPNKLSMSQFYGGILNSFGLADDNHWSASSGVVASLFPDCDSDWEYIGCHNGIDQIGASGQYGSCP